MATARLGNRADGTSTRKNNGLLGRTDLLLAPGGVAALSHIETSHAAFAGGNTSSASTTSTFRDSIHRPHAPAVYASDLALPRRPQDLLLACLLDFDQTGLSPAS